MEQEPTSEHDAAKDSVVPVQGGAVPAVVAELVLALSDPFSGTLAHRAHDVRVTLAQLPLPAHQTRDIVTDHSGPQCPDVPARWRWPCQSIWAPFLQQERIKGGKVLAFRPWSGSFPFPIPHSLRLTGRTSPHKLWRNSYIVAERVIEWSPASPVSQPKAKVTHTPSTQARYVSHTQKTVGMSHKPIACLFNKH